jgi:hypothetical protein
MASFPVLGEIDDFEMHKNAVMYPFVIRNIKLIFFQFH